MRITAKKAAARTRAVSDFIHKNNLNYVDNKHLLIQPENNNNKAKGRTLSLVQIVQGGIASMFQKRA